MIKDHGKIFWDGTRLIVTTPDNKWLFAADKEGDLKQICLKSQEVVKNYGQIHGRAIACLETTRDSKWLITGSCDKHV
jgi:hypothetical protein